MQLLTTDSQYKCCFNLFIANVMFYFIPFNCVHIITYSLVAVFIEILFKISEYTEVAA